MTKKSRRLIAAGIAAVLIILWGYAFLYKPFVHGRWLFVIGSMALALLGVAIQEAARRKADRIDYRRR